MAKPKKKYRVTVMQPVYYYLDVMAKDKIESVSIPTRNIIHSRQIFSLLVSKITEFCLKRKPESSDIFAFDSSSKWENKTELRSIARRAGSAIAHKPIGSKTFNQIIF